MYQMMLESCQTEICQTLKILASENTYPAVFFCQHGKDRTGLIAMLVLGCCFANDEDIVYEYRLSEWRLRPIRHLVHRFYFLFCLLLLFIFETHRFLLQTLGIWQKLG